MNFGSILYAAQNNAGSKSSETRCYKTAFEPPKKEVKTKNLSANVQKFLQKQEEEKRKKEVEAKKKREELLALRSQDKMSQKRMSVMLKRTKSANKSVMEDAIDDVNTSVTMNGPKQCDEDDYGYVSQEASSFYNKMMEKYTSMPAEEPNFLKPKKGTAKDLNAAKERVRAALNRVEEEEMLPRKRKRKSKEGQEGDKEDDFIDDSGTGSSRRDEELEEEEEEKPKPKKPKRPPMPPPMDFQSLLKLAEQKQHEPVVIEKKKKKKDSEDEEDEEEEENEEDQKLMTKKQKLEYLREKEARIQRERRRLEEALKSKTAAKQQERGRERPDKERLDRERKRSDRERERSRSRSPSRSSTSLKGGRERERSKSRSPSRSSTTLKSGRERERSRSRSPSRSSSSLKGRREKERSRSRSPSRSSTTLKGGGSFRIPKTPSENSKMSSENRPSHRIPKLSDKTNKPSLDNTKRLPSSIVEEKLKKSSDVWSKPCNLSPASKIASKSSSLTPKNSDYERRKDSVDRRRDESREKVVKKIDMSSHKSNNGSFERSNKDKLGSSDLKRNIKTERVSDENYEKRKSLSSKSSMQNVGSLNKDRSQENVDRKKIVESTKTSSSSSIKHRSSDVPDRLKDNRLKDERLKDDRLKDNRLKDDRLKDNRLKDDRLKDNRLKDDRSSHKVNGSKSLSNRVSSPTVSNSSSSSKPSKLKSVDLFGNDFPDSAPSLDPRKSNGDFNKPSLSASKPTKVPISAEAGKQRDLKNSTSSSLQKPVERPKAPPPSSANKSGRPSSSDAVRSRQFPPNDLKQRPGDRMKSGNPVRSRQFPPQDVRRRRPSPPRSSRYYADEDDEDEYDSEMDDFIDYGNDDEDNEQVSEIISEIFKYNSSNYSVGDDDEECMESNFGQIDREEFRSLQFGLREDLEDIRREQYEKKMAQKRRLQKLAAMKKKGR